MRCSAAGRATGVDPAQAEYGELVKLFQQRVQRAGQTDHRTVAERQDAAHLSYVELHERGMEFFKQYPRHPLRWDVLVLLQMGPYFVFRPTPDGNSMLLRDPDRYPEWERRYESMLRDLLAAKDASPAARDEALRQLIGSHVDKATRTPQSAAPHVEQVMAWTRTLQEEFPRSGGLLPTYMRVAGMLDRVDPRRCLDFLIDLQRRHASSDPIDARIRAMVNGRLKALQGQAAPITEVWSKLAALDARFRDVAQHRGHVTLLTMFPVTYHDSMAVLKRLHAEFGVAGLRIIQVNQRSTQPDSPEVLRSREALARHVAEQGWPWAIVWDDNPRGKTVYDLFSPNTVPASVLIGRDGVIIAQGANPGSLTEAIRNELR